LRPIPTKKTGPSSFFFVLIIKITVKLLPSFLKKHFQRQNFISTTEWAASLAGYSAVAPSNAIENEV
jgi:cyanate permease